MRVVWGGHLFKTVKTVAHPHDIAPFWAGASSSLQGLLGSCTFSIFYYWIILCYSAAPLSFLPLRGEHCPPAFTFHLSLSLSLPTLSLSLFFQEAHSTRRVYSLDLHCPTSPGKDVQMEVPLAEWFSALAEDENCHGEL